MLGGGKWMTTEMTIYELVRFEGDLTSAALLSLYQIFVLLFFIYFIPSFREKKITSDCQEIGSKWLFVYLLLLHLYCSVHVL